MNQAYSMTGFTCSDSAHIKNQEFIFNLDLNKIHLFCLELAHILCEKLTKEAQQERN